MSNENNDHKLRVNFLKIITLLVNSEILLPKIEDELTKKIHESFSKLYLDHVDFGSLMMEFHGGKDHGSH